MRSTETNLSKVKRALNYYVTTNNLFWIAVGKTQPWINEDLPPLPSPSLTLLPECYGFIYVHKTTLCSRDITGEIIVDNAIYKSVTSNDLSILVNAKSTYLYLEATLPQASLPASYRALGLCNNLTFTNQPTPLVEGTYVGFNNVLSYQLEWVSTFEKIEPNPLINHTIQLIRSF